MLINECPCHVLDWKHIFRCEKHVFESYNSLCRIVTVAGFYRDLKAFCIMIMITMTTRATIILFTLLASSSKGKRDLQKATLINVLK